MNGVALSLTTTATQVSPFDPVAVKAAWKNVGNRKALFPEKNNVIEDFRFKVVTRTGKPARLTAFGKSIRDNPMGRSEYEGIDAGQEEARWYGLGRLFDFSLGGTYKITLDRIVERDDRSHAAVASSPVLEITVDEKFWKSGDKKK